MLYLTEDDVVRFLPMKDCIAAMRAAFERLASGAAINQPRRRLILPSHSVLHYMAAADGGYFGAKIYSTNPRHGAHFLFLLYRAEDAEPVALIEANFLGQIRTGAASGLAASLLAKPGARTAGIIGSGFQARSQAAALASALPLERIRVWSRSAERRERFAHDCSRELGIEVKAVATAEEAARGADVLATATNSAQPVVESCWIGPGTHVNAIGSNQARRRELPSDLVRRADLIVVDSREQSRMESGDLLMALSETEWERVTELQEVAAGRAGRAGADQITLFKSNGVAVEDVAAAVLVYERARDAGAGRPVYS